ncbi:MAG: K+ channel, inward rectifier [Flavobacteriales bacterium]|nr:K+ channel, inward rectifier [Flavobacteriales bacterium]
MATRFKQTFNDLGLGTKASAGKTRTINKDGSFNVIKRNVPLLERINFFHSLVSMSWPLFLLLILSGYFIVNLLFASIYMLVGVEHLTGIEANTPADAFLEAFFFSSQTITTLGYGRVAPIGTLANIIAASESMLGLLGFALATGLLYGRFSKPNDKIKYTQHAVVAPYQDINGFMFRVINPQSNQLLEVEVSMSLSVKRPNSDLRDFYPLELERSKVVFMPSMWTIVHPIDSNSPMYGMTEQHLLDAEGEFIITMKAYDESFSQTVYSRSSYLASEVRWGEKFAYLYRQEADGLSLDVSRMDETEKAPLNEEVINSPNNHTHANYQKT